METSIVTKRVVAAELLEGLELFGGWKVTQKIVRGPAATGGQFSIGYRAENRDGRQGFLKALDFSGAIYSDDPARELQILTEAFNFERDLLERCKRKGLDRIVRALEEGKIVIHGVPVQYLIFEIADCDIRSFMDVSEEIDLAWTLRMLHHVTVGLKQLHGIDIAHQDLKPSNVLVFSGEISKLADLGRSAHPDYQPPHHECEIPGAISYAPPELRYGFLDSDFKRRRYGADLFLLGNIIVFAFTKLTMSALLFSSLAREHRPQVWEGSYTEVLPYLQSAFEIALTSISEYVPEPVRQDVLSILSQLCEPDITLRGDPHGKRGSIARLSLERLITRLNVLAYKAERDLFR